MVVIITQQYKCTTVTELYTQNDTFYVMYFYHNKHNLKRKKLKDAEKKR